MVLQVAAVGLVRVRALPLPAAIVKAPAAVMLVPMLRMLPTLEISPVYPTTNLFVGDPPPVCSCSKLPLAPLLLINIDDLVEVSL